MDVGGRPALDAETELLLYRAAREALRNVTEHADAHHVRLSLGSEDGSVRLVVEDDGAGFSPADLERRRREGHVGLTLLRGLVTEAGGSVGVDSAPGHGTRVDVEVPVR